MSTVAIPYDLEPHPMTGMYNGKFGLWLFLASEIMLFGALFSTYVLLRVGAPEGTWPHHGAEILDVPKGTFNTLILIGSSVTMVLAWASLKMNNFAKGRAFLLVTFLLAGVFLVVKGFEYKAKFTHYQIDLKTPITLHGKSVTRITGHIHQQTEDHVSITPDATDGEEHAAELEIERDNIVRLTDFGPSHSTFLAIYFTMTGLHGLHIIGGMAVILYLLLAAPSMWNGNREKLINRVECTGLYWHFVDLVWIFLFPVFYLL